MGNTLNGWTEADFQKYKHPPVTAELTDDLNSNTTKTLLHFSMPSGADTVKVRSAHVADQNGDPQTGLSLVVRDSTNGNVIHSETSAQIQRSGDETALAEGGSATTKVTVEAKNETGSNLTQPSGHVSMTLE